MKLEYNFKDIFNKISPPDTSKDGRENFRITKCCGNCKYAWWPHANERCGFCRLGQMDKRAPGRSTPHRNWEHMKVHATNLCDKHTYKSTGYWLNRVIRWVSKKFDLNGELLDD